MSQAKSRIFTKEFFVLCLAAFCVSYGAFSLNASVPLYVKTIGGSTNITGLLNTAFTVCACVFRIGGGYLTDRFGRKPIIVIGGIVLAVTTVLYSWITNLALLVIVRGLQGAGFAMMSIGCATALVDVLPAERFGEGLGYYSLSSTVSQSIASALAITLITAGGYFTTFGSTAAIAAIGVVITLLFCTYERTPAYQAERKAVREAKAAEGSKTSLISEIFEKQAIMPAVVMTMYAIGVAISYVYMTLYAVENNVPHPGLYFTFSSIFAVFSRIIGGKLADRDNSLPGLLFGFLMCIASFVILFIPDTSGVWYCVSGAAFGVAGGFISPILNRIAVHGVSSDRRGAASATFSMSNDIGTGVGGALWGMTIASWGYTVTFTTVIGWLIFSTVFMVGYILIRQKHRR